MAAYAQHEESLDILGLAWRGERFDYSGRVFNVKGGLLRPPPIVPGRLPLWIGAAALFLQGALLERAAKPHLRDTPARSASAARSTRPSFRPCCPASQPGTIPE